MSCKDHSLLTVTKLSFGEKDIQTFCQHCEKKAPKQTKPFNEKKYFSILQTLQKFFNEELRNIIDKFNEFKDKYYNVCEQMENICSLVRCQSSSVQMSVIKQIIDFNEQLFRQKMFAFFAERGQSSPKKKTASINIKKLQSSPQPAKKAELQLVQKTAQKSGQGFKIRRKRIESNEQGRNTFENRQLQVQMQRSHLMIDSKPAHLGERQTSEQAQKFKIHLTGQRLPKLS